MTTSDTGVQRADSSSQVAASPDDLLDELAERLRDLSYRGRQMIGPEATAYARFLLPVVKRAEMLAAAEALRDAAQDLIDRGGRRRALTVADELLARGAGLVAEVEAR